MPQSKSLLYGHANHIPRSKLTTRLVSVFAALEMRIYHIFSYPFFYLDTWGGKLPTVRLQYFQFFVVKVMTYTSRLPTRQKESVIALQTKRYGKQLVTGMICVILIVVFYE